MKEESYGGHIKEFREANKLSQQKIADLTGYTRSSINSIERNDQRPPIDFLVKFSKVIGVSLDVILTNGQSFDENDIHDMKHKIEAIPNPVLADEIKRYIAKLEADQKSMKLKIMELDKKYKAVLNELEVVYKKLKKLF